MFKNYTIKIIIIKTNNLDISDAVFWTTCHVWHVDRARYLAKENEHNSGPLYYVYIKNFILL